MLRVSRRVRRALALAVFLVVQTAAATQLPKRPPDLPPDAGSAGQDPCAARGEAAPVYLPRLLRVIVNEADSRQELVFLQRRCGALLARPVDLRALRIRAAGQPVVVINGDPYVNLNAFPSLTYRLDSAAQKLWIEGEPSVFDPTVINLERDRIPRTGVSPGAFLNYGLFTSDSVEGGHRAWNGAATLGVFGEPGVLVNDWIYYRQERFERDYRVASTFFRDYPERISTLRVGDVFTRGGAFGSTLPIAGLQYGTNFLTRPFLITSPVEMMEAATRRMAVVDLFNAQLEDPERQSRAAFLSGIATAPHGPVEIINIPTYQNGQYVLTLRDALGREYTVRQAFFFSQGLLRQGLHDFSYEAGLRRVGTGDRYEGAVVTGTHRYGFDARLTGEAHGEVAEDGEALGGSVHRAIPYVGVLGATAAASRNDAIAGTGWFGALGLENAYRQYAYAVRQECRSNEFFLPSAPATGANPLACRTFASASRAVTEYDNVSFSVTQTDLREQPDTRSYRVGYVTRRIRGLSFTAFATYTEEPIADLAVGLLASASLATIQGWRGETPPRSAPTSLTDPRRVHYQVTAEGGRDREPVVVGRVSSGVRRHEQDFGVHASAGLLNRDLQTVSGSWSNRYLTTSAGLTSFFGEDSYAAGGASGVAWIDGRWYATRPLTSGFAVVRLGEEHGGVRVNGYRTDANGDVLLTPMQPYRENPIGISGADLPMNARFDALSLTASPRYRSGTVVRPGITVLRDAILSVRLLDETGRQVPLPTGAYATVPGSGEWFPTGEDGAVYVIGLEPVTAVTVHWNDQECVIEVVSPSRQPLDHIPELGPFVCEGVRP